MTGTDELIRAVAERLGQAAPDATIILFGSHARGDARPDSDLDILVIEHGVVAQRAEAARLRDVLGDLDASIDIIVTSRATFEEWAEESGTVIHEAAREGRVLHGPA